ncbi:hypothetical protein MFRU_006g02730 [Monilinia fructicola]|nr:hypothetical protein MFRU_006g02730 [Monilinia fructicola]
MPNERYSNLAQMMAATASLEYFDGSQAEDTKFSKIWLGEMQAISFVKSIRIYEVENEVAEKSRTNKGECYIGKEEGDNEGDDGANDDIEMNGKNKGKLVEGEGEEEKIDEDREQWGKALQIRKKLRQYCKSFLFPENTIISTNNLPQPREHDISVLRKWLERPKLGNYPLPSRDKDSWSAQHEDDLFALQRKPTSDLFSRWMIWSCVPYLHRKLLRNFTRPLPTRETPEPSLPQTQHTILNSGGTPSVEPKSPIGSLEHQAQ